MAEGSNVRTMVLVGRTGNGKSATGNTILGRKAFVSRTSSSGITMSSHLQSTVLDDGKGKVINVIDTPGIFDATVGADYISKEIVKCVDKAKDGIHAIVVVLSVRTRFSQEEDAALKTFQEFFGPKIIDYMIILFTGGDDLEDNEVTLEQYLGRECPEKLKNILRMCKNRYILFDNKTKDPAKKEQQLKELLELVDATIDESDGKPYTSDLIIELKKEAEELRRKQEEADALEGRTKQEILEMKEELQKEYEQKLSSITGAVEAQVKEIIKTLGEQLTLEQNRRLEAEQRALASKDISDEEVRQLKANIEAINEENRKRRKGPCSIM